MSDNNLQVNGVNGSCSSEDETPLDTQAVPTNGDELEPPKEEERTLTDHLNKRLLESFLTRLQEGSVAMPQNSADEEIIDEDSFDNDK